MQKGNEDSLVAEFEIGADFIQHQTSNIHTEAN